MLVAVSVCVGGLGVEVRADTDPGNDTQAGADALGVGVGGAVLQRGVLLDSGSDVDHFGFTAAPGEVVLGIVAPESDLPDTFDDPDTLLGVIDSDGEVLVANDDDEAGELTDAGGSGFGSAVRFQAQDDAVGNDYTIAVTGFDDVGFLGEEHGESGAYALTVGRVDPSVLGGGFADSASNNDLVGADDLGLLPLTAAVSVAELSEEGGDVDFYKVNLRMGDVLSALVAPVGDLPDSFDVPDTLLGLFDADGVLLAESDDLAFGEGELPAADSLGSAIRASIPADGVYYLGVTSTFDEDYDGLDDGSDDPHDGVGRYALLVSRVPEPATGGLLLVAGLVGVGRLARTRTR